MPAQPLIIVIGIAIVANLVIMGALIVTLVRRWRPEPAETSAAVDDARLIKATTTPDSFSNDLPESSQESIELVTAADDARRFRSVLEDEPHAADQEAIAFFVSPPTSLGPREEPPEAESQAEPEAESEAEPEFERTFEPEYDSAPPRTGDLGGVPAEQTVVWTDAPQPRKSDATPLPRVDAAVDWERRVREESTRLIRYRRPVTVVLVELDGFERLLSRLGPDAADRLIPAIAETLVRNGRATDHVARLGASRFGVLMPETDEIQAINYAERIRAQCDRWLASGSISTRIALGWACPTPGSDLAAAIRIAEERLQGDRRRTGWTDVAT
jgi:diguanylate cyclase (GGDEF)-like protein